MKVEYKWSCEEPDLGQGIFETKAFLQSVFCFTLADSLVEKGERQKGGERSISLKTMFEG